MASSKFLTHHIIVDGNLGADITSDEIKSENLDKLNVFVSWTGSSPVGSLIVQGSVDGSTWSDIGVTEPTITGASGSGFVICDSSKVCWKRMRLFWDFTSGTGTVQAWIHAQTY